MRLRQKMYQAHSTRFECPEQAMVFSFEEIVDHLFSHHDDGLSFYLGLVVRNHILRGELRFSQRPAAVNDFYKERNNYLKRSTPPIHPVPFKR